MNFCSLIFLSLLQLFVQVTANAQIAPTNLATCTTMDSNMRNTEVFAVLSDGGDPYLQFQKIVNGFVAVNEVLATNLVCKFHKVKGFDSLICFSTSGFDKLIFDHRRGFSFSIQNGSHCQYTELKESAQ
jgi:hypothetical protein